MSCLYIKLDSAESENNYAPLSELSEEIRYSLDWRETELKFSSHYCCSDPQACAHRCPLQIQ